MTLPNLTVNKSMKMNWDQLFDHTFLLGVLFATWLYFVKFNDFSETELIRWSYFWIPLVVYGLAGKVAMRNLAYLEAPFVPASIIATKWTIVLTAALIIFYEVFWDLSLIHI